MPSCAECDVEIELEEPRTCYYTGRGYCGDCPSFIDCFGPLFCDECLEYEAKQESQFVY